MVIGSKKKQERYESNFSPTFCPGRGTRRLARDACCSWGLGYSDELEREVRRGWSIGCTGNVGRDEGRLQLVFCCSSRDETGIGFGRTKRQEWVFRQPTWVSGRLSRFKPSYSDLLCSLSLHSKVFLLLLRLFG